MIHVLTPGYELDDDRGRLDLDAAWDLLEREAYWGRYRTKDVFVRQVDRSWRVIGAYAGKAQVGFARVLSDGEALAYLADVIIEPAHRGRGIGVAMIRELLERPPADTFRWMLHTLDAHPIYARFGFAAPDATYLERPRPPA